MRKFIFGCLVITGVMSFGQIQKGTKLIEAGFSYDKDDLSIESFGGTTNEDIRFFRILSGVGYAVGQNQIITANLFYNGEKGSTTLVTSQGISSSSSERITKHFGFRIGYEYMFQISDKFYISPFISASIGKGDMDIGQLVGSTYADFVEYDFTLTPRVHYLINEWSVFISFSSLQYINRKTTFEEGTTRASNPNSTDSFDAEFDLRTLNLGVRYYLFKEN